MPDQEPVTSRKAETSKKVKDADKKQDEYIEKILNEEEDEENLYYSSCAVRSRKLKRENRSWMRMKIEELFFQAEKYEEYQNQQHTSSLNATPSSNHSQNQEQVSSYNATPSSYYLNSQQYTPSINVTPLSYYSNSQQYAPSTNATPLSYYSNSQQYAPSISLTPSSYHSSNQHASAYYNYQSQSDATIWYGQTPNSYQNTY